MIREPFAWGIGLVLLGGVLTYEIYDFYVLNDFSVWDHLFGVIFLGVSIILIVLTRLGFYYPFFQGCYGFLVAYTLWLFNGLYPLTLLCTWIVWFLSITVGVRRIWSTPWIVSGCISGSLEVLTFTCVIVFLATY